MTAYVLKNRNEFRRIFGLRRESKRSKYGRVTEAATGAVLLKKGTLKKCKIHRKTPVLESLFNKVAEMRPATLLKMRL